MPVRSDPATATQKWVTNISAATTQIQNGVNRVTRAPGQQAAAASDKWFQRIQQSQAKWKANVGRVSLADWQQSMLNVGIPRIASGASAKQGKMQNFLQQFLPYLQTGVTKIDAMPSVTLDDGINRAVAMIRHNAAFKRTGTGA